MVETLHDRSGIHKSALWEELAEHFDAVDEMNIHEPCDEDGEVSEEENAELTEWERLLTRGQDMSVEEKARVLAGP